MRTKLTHKEMVADKTIEFRFEKPEGFTWQAGQSIDLTLIDVPVTDKEGNTRAYSLASAPHEPELMIATRLRDTAFKNFLKDAPLGTEVSFDGPFGSFFLHENVKRPAVFMAGGIGITPFRSMIVDAKERGLPHKMVLLYSNREEKDATFLTELKSLQMPNLTLVTRFTATEGHIDQSLIQGNIDLESSPIFYIAGPTTMVFALRKLLNEMGVSNDDIRFEEFAGY